MPLHSNPATTLFVPDKQGGSVSLRTIERWGQSRPAPCSTWLSNSTISIASGGSMNIPWTTVENDGNGIGNFGIKTAYGYGATVSFASGCWSVYLQLITTVVAGDSYSMTVIPLDSASAEALPFPFGTNWTATPGLVALGALPNLTLANLVVGGWAPLANGQSRTASLAIYLAYEGSGTKLFQPNLIISRVS